jgi:hypothetical protein
MRRSLPGGLFARWAPGGTRYHACLLKEPPDRPGLVVTEALCGRWKRREWRENVVRFQPWEGFADRAYSRAEACPRCVERAARLAAPTLTEEDADVRS